MVTWPMQRHSPATVIWPPRQLSAWSRTQVPTGSVPVGINWKPAGQRHRPSPAGRSLQTMVTSARGGAGGGDLSVMQAPPSTWELGGQTSGGGGAALVSAGAGGGLGIGCARTCAGAIGADLETQTPSRNSCQGKQRSAGSESCAHTVPGPQRPRQSPNSAATEKRVISCPIG
jgi:hypothetical protein